MMILICTASGDHSTAKVIEWLSARKEPYVVVDEFSPIEHIQISLSNNKEEIHFDVAGIHINLSDIKSVWFRRDRIQFKADYNRTAFPEIFRRNFDHFIRTEHEKLKAFLLYQLSKKCVINIPVDMEINKLQVLQIAIKHGIRVPDTYIGSPENATLKGPVIINKPISEVINFYYDKYMCRLLTVEYDQAEANGTFPILLQDKIEKIFEVRTFYLNDVFYSIAIFSQQNVATQTDYRKYDFSDPVRSVPFALPPKLEQQCRNMMRELKLLSGSIDFIYSEKNEFIFLEVNPVGQFDKVSDIGNYYLEEQITSVLRNGTE